MFPATANCLLVFDIGEPTWLAVQVAVARRPGLDICDRFEALNNSVPLTAQELTQPHGGRAHLIRAEPGRLVVTYGASVNRSAPVGAEPVAQAQRVQAICAYAWEHIRYEFDASGPATDAVDTLLTGHGVCRYFAHLVAALCRAVEVPARIAAVYAPGLSPMDFHVVVETATDGSWYAWDAARSAPRPGMIRIATGRDAADVAFSSVLTGRADLTSMQITVAGPDDLPLDAHDELVVLG
jgi:transglutaminase superfamily protein